MCWIWKQARCNFSIADMVSRRGRDALWGEGFKASPNVEVSSQSGLDAACALQACSSFSKRQGREDTKRVVILCWCCPALWEGSSSRERSPSALLRGLCSCRTTSTGFGYGVHCNFYSTCEKSAPFMSRWTPLCGMVAERGISIEFIIGIGQCYCSMVARVVEVVARGIFDEFTRIRYKRVYILNCTCKS